MWWTRTRPRSGHALIYGDFTSAVQRCLQTGRLADAIIFSSFGPPTLWEETRNHYFSVHPHPFIRNVMKNVSSSHLEEMVASSPLLASDPSAATSSWKETLAILITYTTTERYRALVNQLAERLEAAGQALPALICYMCSSNIDRAVELFSRQLVDAADPVMQLHTSMEKIAVFAMATSAHLQQPPSTLLSMKYSEYATLLASQGFIIGAWNYLKVSNPSGSDPASAVLLDRLFHASYASDQPIQQQPPAFPFHPIVQVGVDVVLAQVEGAYEMNKRNRQALVQATQQHQHAQTHHTPQIPPQPNPPPGSQYPPPHSLPAAQPAGPYGGRPGAPQFPPASSQPGYPQQGGAGQVHPATPYPPGVYNPGGGQPGLPSQPYPTQPYRPGGQPQPPLQQQQPHALHLPPAQNAYPGHPQQPQQPQPPQPQARQPYNPQQSYSQPPPQQPQYPAPPPHGQVGGHAGSGGPAQLNYPQPSAPTPAYPPQPTAPPSVQAPRLPPPQQPPPHQHAQQTQQPGYPPQQPTGPYHAPLPQPGGGGAYPPPGQPPAGPSYPPQPAMPHPSQQHPAMPPMPQPGQSNLPAPHVHPQQPHDPYNQHPQHPQPPQPTLPSNPQAPPSQPRIFNPAAPSPHSAAPAPPATYPAPQPTPSAALPAAAHAASSAASLSSLSFSPECQQLVSVLEGHFEQLTQRAPPTEQRKIADLHHRLTSLYHKLALPQSQSLSPSLLGELSALCQCVLQADYNGCKRHHTALVKNDWTGNNEWILALKSFLDLFKKYLWIDR